MEPKDTFKTPMCSAHHDQVARAVCLRNKELLCFACVLDKAKSDAYTVQEIDKIAEGKETILLEYLLMKQMASRKKNLIVEYERKAEEVKDNLEQQVNKRYGQLFEKLAKLKENTILSLESKRKLFLEDFYGNKKELDAVQKIINENIEKLSVSTVSDVDSCKSRLEEVKNKLIHEIAEYDSNPEGVFTAFQETISESRADLGEIKIYDTDPHYSSLLQDETHASDEVYLTVKSEKPSNLKVVDSQAPKLPPKPRIVSSVEIREKPKVHPRAEAKSNRSSVNEDTSCSASTTEEKVEPKHEKARKSKFGIFSSKDKRKVSEKLEDYEQVEFDPTNLIQAKYLINTAVSLSGLPSLPRPCEFSKLVNVGSDRIGLLSTKHSTVVVAQLDGKVQSSKAYPEEITSIVAMENNQLAILIQKEGTKIETVFVTDKELEGKSTIDLELELADFAGFDYSKRKSRFAVSTRVKHVVIDRKGKKIKSTDIGNITGSSDIATTYDFENDCIYVLNKGQKSIKCVSLKSLEPVWKCKCVDQLFQPKAVCLYNAKLCVASAGTVTIFEAKDGKAVRKHDTANLVKDCLGICVIDDVLVISSNSDNFDKSGKLGFIGI